MVLTIDRQGFIDYVLFTFYLRLFKDKQKKRNRYTD